MVTVQYPDITIFEIPTIDDKEILYWTHRVSELRIPLSKLAGKLFSYHKEDNKMLIGLLTAIIRRQLEIADSFLLLVSKGKVRDSGILILNLYELTLDLQYLSINPGHEQIWLTHHKETKKPWSVHEQIKAIFPIPSEYEAEKNLYKSYSMIKHGNIAGKHIAFDIFLQEDKLAFSFPAPSFAVSNLYGVGLLLNRTFNASTRILKEIGIEHNEIEVEMKKVYAKFFQNMTTLLQLKVTDMTFRDDPKKQREVIERLNLSFE